MVAVIHDRAEYGNIRGQCVSAPETVHRAQQQQGRRLAGREQPPETGGIEHAEHKRDGEQEQGAAHQRDQPAQPIFTHGLIVAHQDDQAAAQGRAQAENADGGDGHGLGRRFRNAEERGNRPGKQRQQPGQSRAQSQTPAERQPQHAFQAVPVVFLGKHGGQRLHGFGGSLEHRGGHIGNVHHHIEHGHIQVAVNEAQIPRAQQQAVAQRQEQELEYIANGGGKADDERGMNLFTDFLPIAHRPQDIFQAQHTAAGKQMDAQHGHADRLGGHGGDDGTQHTHAQDQHKHNVQRQVNGTAQGKAQRGQTGAVVAPHKIVQDEIEHENGRGGDHGPGVGFAQGQQLRTAAVRAQQGKQGRHQQIAPDGDHRGNAQQPRRHRAEMAQRVVIPGGGGQFAVGDAAARGKTVADQVIDHVNRRNDTDGGQALFAHPGANYQGVGNIRHGQRHGGNQRGPQHAVKHLAGDPKIFFHLIASYTFSRSTGLYRIFACRRPEMPKSSSRLIRG